VVGGELIRLEWATSDLFFVAAVPAVLGAVSMLALWRTVLLTKSDASAASLSQGQPSATVQLG